MSRPLYVHVGSRKTGTSALQLALWNSTKALAAAGLATPLVGRQQHVRQLLHPLGWRYGRGFVRSTDRRALGRLVEKLRHAPGERVLLSNEALAEAGPSEIAAFVNLAEAAKFDLHVVVTARDWAQQLPSEWQQVLKEQLTLDYETFLAKVRERDGPDGEQFWRRQDVLDICDRWGAVLDPSQVHVIVVPPAAADRDAVYRLFGEVVGFDRSSLSVRTEDINASLGYTEAELLRRLNVALVDRLAANEYTPAIRRVLIKRVLEQGTSSKIPLPPSHVEWVRQVSEERVTTILERGYRVHGDQALLVPTDDVGRPIPPVDDAALAEAAVRTLAEFAVAEFRIARAQSKPAPATTVSSPAVHKTVAAQKPRSPKALAGRIRPRFSVPQRSAGSRQPDIGEPSGEFER